VTGLLGRVDGVQGQRGQERGSPCCSRSSSRGVEEITWVIRGVFRLSFKSARGRQIVSQRLRQSTAAVVAGEAKSVFLLRLPRLGELSQRREKLQRRREKGGSFLAAGQRLQRPPPQLQRRLRRLRQRGGGGELGKGGLHYFPIYYRSLLRHPPSPPPPLRYARLP
jgi:hypothetical protein